jgi:hypothetical protein
VQEKVLSRLSVEDVDALLETVDAAIERSEDSGTLVDLREFADERGLRAIARYEEALEAVSREVALAKIFKEISLFYRYLVSWTTASNPNPNEPTAASSGIPAREHVNDQYQKFAHTFYDVTVIWLGKNTYDLIQVLSVASRDLLNDLKHMRARADIWCLPDGTNPDDRRKERITPKYFEVRDELRAEVEASRGLISWFQYRIVNMKNTLGQRRTDPEEGE